jgi:lysozyme
VPKDLFDIDPAEVAAVAEMRAAQAMAVLESFAREAEGALPQGLFGGGPEEVTAAQPVPAQTEQKTSAGEPVAGPALAGQDLATDVVVPVEHPRHLAAAMTFLRDKEAFDPKPRQDNITKKGEKRFTIGYGDQVDFRTGRPVTKNTPPMSKEEAEAALELRAKKFARVVEENVAAPLTENQRAALISTAYNIGAVQFANSSFVKKLNSGAPFKDILPDLQKYVYARLRSAKARRVPGLVNRRNAEFRLGTMPDAGEESEGGGGTPLP